MSAPPATHQRTAINAAIRALYRSIERRVEHGQSARDLHDLIRRLEHRFIGTSRAPTST